MAVKEKIFIGLLVLVIALSVGSVAIVSNLGSENSQEQTSYEEEQVGNLNLGIIGTTKNSEVNG